MTTTATKERPILFSGPMVRAILAGQKTQTRRVVKGIETSHWDAIQPLHCASASGRYLRCGNTEIDERSATFCDGGDSNAWAGELSLCPLGQPGDRLWVRETWAPSEPGPVDEDSLIAYRADYLDDPHGPDGEKSPEGKYRTWKPSIHMPRWASRITLEITDVRVERLHDISESDALAEGCEPLPITPEDTDKLTPGSFEWALSAELEGGSFTSKFMFDCLWKDLYGKESYYANPWVWVIEFRRIEH